LTWITDPSCAAGGAIPSLAEADAVIASSSAQPINAMRLIVVLPSHACDIVYKFPALGLFRMRRNLRKYRTTRP
jgi:hypothetical protein